MASSTSASISSFLLVAILSFYKEVKHGFGVFHPALCCAVTGRGVTLLERTFPGRMDFNDDRLVNKRNNLKVSEAGANTFSVHHISLRNLNLCVPLRALSVSLSPRRAAREPRT